MKSWKTTSAGALAIIGAITTLWFHRGALSPELVMGAATAILSGLGLVLARDNDKSSEDVGAKSQTATLPKTGPLLALALCAGLLAVTPGCSTSPPMAVYRATSTAHITVDAAMRAWGDYVAQFHPPVSQEAAVRDAFNKYKLAQLAVLDAAIGYQQAQSDGAALSQAQRDLNAALAAAGAALGDLTSLITSFGVNLQPPGQ